MPFAPAREADVIDTEPGRAGYAALSIVVEPDYYLAHRVLLGLRKGVGARSCNALAMAVIDNDRNYRDLFYETPPVGLVPHAFEHLARGAAFGAYLLARG